MHKYLQVFKISFQQEFAYRLNFVMWRVRNVIQIFIVFFLWDAVFRDPGKMVFGYDRAKILTYVFGILIVRSLVLSARAVDVAEEIASGDFSNYLLKPFSYFKYWLTRDFSSKVLNLIFAFFEFMLLFVLLKPPLFFQSNSFYLFAFILSLILAILIFFILLFLVSSVPFWMPESGWGAQFLFVGIITEFLSGAVFPLDIFPSLIQKILYALPFPYLIFFPLQVYLGKLSPPQVFQGLGLAFFWLIILWFLLKIIWNRGLKVYQAFGR